MKKHILSVLLLLTVSTYTLYVRVSGASPVADPVIVVTVPEAPVAILPTVVEATSTKIVKPVVKPVTKPVVEPIVVTTPAPISPLIQIPDPNPVPVIVEKPKGQYLDGTYDGKSVDAYYGQVQVRAVISGGKLVDVIFLDYPQDRGTSKSINNRAMNNLKQEAISIQNYKVNTVSGATDTTGAFRQSLRSALDQAKNV